MNSEFLKSFIPLWKENISNPKIYKNKDDLDIFETPSLKQILLSLYDSSLSHHAILIT